MRGATGERSATFRSVDSGNGVEGVRKKFFILDLLMCCRERWSLKSLRQLRRGLASVGCPRAEVSIFEDAESSATGTGEFKANVLATALALRQDSASNDGDEMG